MGNSASLDRSHAGSWGRSRWLFTTREGGVSRGAYASLNLADQVGDAAGDVATNRALVADAVGVGVDRLILMQACHGSEVSVVDGSAADDFHVDALVTTTPGVAIGALAADCLPVLLSDPDAGVIAAVHSGWMGVRDDVVGNAVERMRSLGASSIQAMVGPSVCGRCYPVPPDRVAAVAAVVPEAQARTDDGRPSLDLTVGILARLKRAGVDAASVHVCTVESQRHFSYRRDRTTGRHAGIIVLGES